MPQRLRRRAFGCLQSVSQHFEITKEIITKIARFEVARRSQITYMNRTLNRFPEFPLGR